MKLIKTTSGRIVMITTERKFSFYSFAARTVGSMCNSYCFSSETSQDMEYLKEFFMSKGFEIELSGKGDVPCYSKISGFKVRADIHLHVMNLNPSTLEKVVAELRGHGYLTSKTHKLGFDVIQ